MKDLYKYTMGGMVETKQNPNPTTITYTSWGVVMIKIYTSPKEDYPFSIATVTSRQNVYRTDSTCCSTYYPIRNDLGTSLIHFTLHTALLLKERVVIPARDIFTYIGNIICMYARLDTTRQRYTNITVLRGRSIICAYSTLVLIL